MNRDIYIPRLNSIRGILFLLAMTVALSIGLVFAAPAHGATLHQDASGDITGSVSVNGQSVAGITVELRQRNNGGQDKTLASSTTDASGTYHFRNQPSAPNDAFYYVRFVGGKNALASWYSFPIIYMMGSQVTVPAVDLGDVILTGPAQAASVTLPAKFSWNSRRMGETYRLFIYAEGKLDKPVLDSGSLGTGTEFDVAESALQPGTYEGVVQVRDAVAGYGQSQARFHFAVGGAAPHTSQPPQGEATPTAAPSSGGTAGADTQGSAVVPDNGAAASPTAAAAVVPVAPAQPTQPAQPDQGASSSAPAQAKPDASSPDINVNLSADKTAVNKGDNITYKIEVQNSGKGAASGVVVTDNLPEGVSVDATTVKSPGGKVTVEGGKVTIAVGDIAPGEKSTIEIPAKVQDSTAKNVSNQASATYAGAADAVQSNAYIAEVAEPVSGPASGSAQQPANSQPAAPQGSANENVQPSAPAAPQSSQPAQAPDAPKAAPPAASQGAAPASGTGSASSSQPRSAASAPQSGTVASPKANTPAKQPVASMPHTGGSFPVLLAVVLVVLTLLARYLRGFAYRRV